MIVLHITKQLPFLLFLQQQAGLLLNIGPTSARPTKPAATSMSIKLVYLVSTRKPIFEIGISQNFISNVMIWLVFQNHITYKFHKNFNINFVAIEYHITSEYSYVIVITEHISLISEQCLKSLQLGLKIQLIGSSLILKKIWSYIIVCVYIYKNLL